MATPIPLRYRTPMRLSDVRAMVTGGASGLGGATTRHLIEGGGRVTICDLPGSKGAEVARELGERAQFAPTDVTDGTFLPGGDRIALLTYTSIEVLDASSYKVLASAAIPRQPQAESLTMTLDQQSLLVGSEGKKSRVYSVAIPSEATPTPTPSEDPGAETDVPEDQTASIQNQKGTMLTLGLAGFVALVAGTVVALARKP